MRHMNLQQYYSTVMGNGHFVEYHDTVLAPSSREMQLKITTPFVLLFFVSCFADAQSKIETVLSVRLALVQPPTIDKSARKVLYYLQTSITSIYHPFTPRNNSIH